MADDTNTAEREAAEQWLRYRYGAYRGHFAWRELEEAFKAGRASLAASAGSEPVACNRFAWGRLYDKASILMAVIGRDGEVSSRADEVALLMHALHDVDGGKHMPGLMPAAKLITPAPPVVETSPGSPNFEGGAAYEAYMAADTPPSPPEGIAGGWRQIATAPKDGTYLLLWEQYSTHPFVGYWGFGSWSASHEHVDAEGGWDGANVVDSISQDLITHWMPLPAPPLPASEAKEL